MVRTQSKYIELSGPLFADDVKKRFKSALYEGMGEIAVEGEAIMVAAIYRGFPSGTGQTAKSVESMGVRKTDDVAGYYKITPTDMWKGTVTVTKVGRKTVVNKKGKKRRANVWSVLAVSDKLQTGEKGRPTKIWLTKGIRRGVKLRTGHDFYAQTSRALKSLDPTSMVAPYIRRALDD